MKKSCLILPIVVSFLSFASPVAAHDFNNDPSGTDIVCNSLQGVRTLYFVGGLVAPGHGDISCSGEVFVLWSQIEPEEGVYVWDALDAKLDQAVEQNREVTFTLGVSGNGLEEYPVEAPDWLFEVMQSEADLCCRGITRLGTRSTPIPWNTVFQAKLKTILEKIRDHIRSNPEYDRLVSAIVMYCGGPWGEMNLCHGGRVGCHLYGTWEEWVEAGYTHQGFAEAVMDLIGVHMEVFRDRPGILQGGNGMFWGDPNPPSGNYWEIRPGSIVGGKAVAKYGTRIIFKKNGFGTVQTTPAGEICALHRCSEESGHNYPDAWCWWEDGQEVCGPSNEDEYFDHFLRFALTGHLDWLGPSFTTEFPQNPNALAFFARHAGAQIMNLATTFPSVVETGQAAEFRFEWFNRGNLPLYKTALVGVKGVPVSYNILVDLVDSSGNTVFHQVFLPTPGTQDWPLTESLAVPGWCVPGSGSRNPTQIINRRIFFPLSLASGEYKVLIGLSDPKDDSVRWNLVNTDGNDGTARYEVGTIQITEGDYPFGAGWNTGVWPGDFVRTVFSEAAVLSERNRGRWRMVTEEILGGWGTIPRKVYLKSFL